ncbi:MAG: pyruvate kinase [Defluviitaleaceae bacterium]|nr:pyruvate kinase [Defluviitaleaceae bacterium]
MNISQQIKKTKIVCTLGPSTDDDNVLRKMFEYGMDVARLNFSHSVYADHDMRVGQVKRIRAELNKPIPIMLDTSGPEIRLKSFKNGLAQLKAGQTFILTTDDIEGDDTRASITYVDLPKDVTSGMRIMIDDGNVELRVESTTETEIFCKVIHDSIVKNRKSVNVPDANLTIPFISAKDLSDIKYGISMEVDLIAASFTRTAQDVLDVRKVLAENGGEDIKIIAKIENRQGVNNLDEILEVSDGVMVARGDMGVEIPLEELPKIQKVMIKKAYSSGKIVITATQMLESMMENPRPTRAETTDIANAVFDGTSAVMLSGETAAGAFPVEAVETMARIVRRAEVDMDYIDLFNFCSAEKDITDAISHATCTTAHDIGASAILTYTESGLTARMISKFRPQCPIIACVTKEQICRQLNLSWGIVPIMAEYMETTDEVFKHVIDRSISTGIVKKDDTVIITAGVPVGISGTTNILKAEVV